MGELKATGPAAFGGLENFERGVEFVEVHGHGLNRGRRVSFLIVLLPECHKVLRRAADVVAIHVIFTKSAAYGNYEMAGEGSGMGGIQARRIKSWRIA